ncbi:adapter protein, putative [Theileria annulata]|uniref:Adapter protein, putative n=1 Tax=Theileria annulata TaxID=5874 RepID=Q4UAJ2_THEAN|nr:adapter protein, putative [Theileria annulata]CAI76159.1 adapter protein, putative [Theileria annulata]|eukprot:XP_952785.1 adapter protein, putative [Theileria annulata]
MLNLEISNDFHKFIKSINETNSKYGLEKLIYNEITKLKLSFQNKNITKNEIYKNLLKCLHINMFGFNIKFAYIHAINLAQDKDLKYKSLGYLCCTLMLQNNNDLIILLINTIQKVLRYGAWSHSQPPLIAPKGAFYIDLNSNNVMNKIIVLNNLNYLINEEMLEIILPMILNCLIHENELVRKKTIILLTNIFQQFPTHLNNIHSIIERGIYDINPSVMNVTLILIRISIINGIKLNKELYINLLINIWKQILDNKLNKTYYYNKIPAPFIQINIIKLLTILCNNIYTSNLIYNILYKFTQSIESNTITHTNNNFTQINNNLNNLENNNNFNNLNNLNWKNNWKNNRIEKNVNIMLIYEFIKLLSNIHINNILLSISSIYISKLLNSEGIIMCYMSIICINKLIDKKLIINIEDQLKLLKLLTIDDEIIQINILKLLFKLINKNNFKLIFNTIFKHYNSLNFKSFIEFNIINIFSSDTVSGPPDSITTTTDVTNTNSTNSTTNNLTTTVETTTEDIGTIGASTVTEEKNPNEIAVVTKTGESDTFMDTPGKGADSTLMECTPGKGANSTAMECTMGNMDTNIEGVGVDTKETPFGDGREPDTVTEEKWKIKILIELLIKSNNTFYILNNLIKLIKNNNKLNINWLINKCIKLLAENNIILLLIYLLTHKTQELTNELNKLMEEEILEEKLEMLEKNIEILEKNMKFNNLKLFWIFNNLRYNITSDTVLGHTESTVVPGTSNTKDSTGPSTVTEEKNPNEIAVVTNFGESDTFSEVEGKGANFTVMECTMGKGANFTVMECTMGKGANFTAIECTTTTKDSTTKDIVTPGKGAKVAVGPSTVTGDTVTELYNKLMEKNCKELKMKQIIIEIKNLRKYKPKITNNKFYDIKLSFLNNWIEKDERRYQRYERNEKMEIIEEQKLNYKPYQLINTISNIENIENIDKEEEKLIINIKNKSWGPKGYINNKEQDNNTKDSTTEEKNINEIAVVTNTGESGTFTEVEGKGANSTATECTKDISSTSKDTGTVGASTVMEKELAKKLFQNIS